MTADRARRAVGFVALLLLVILLGRAATALDLARVARELSSARPAWVAAALGCYLGVLPLWALQWQLLAPPAPDISWRRMLQVVAMTSTVLNTTPMLVGEVASVVFLVTNAGLARASAISVLAMDQLLVGLGKVAVLGAATLATPLATWLARGVWGLVAGVALLLGIVGVAAWRHTDVPRVLGRVVPQRVADAVGRASHALAPMRSARLAAGAFSLAIAKLLLELCAILAVQHAFALDLPVGSALLVLAALHLATLLPLVPGNLGIYETAVVLAYARYGVDAERALGMAVVQHACALAAFTLPGYRWLLLARPTRSAAAAP